MSERITEEKPDTVTVVRVDTVRVTDMVTRVVYRDRRLAAQIDSSHGRHDTVLICEPFEAAVDTMAGQARVQGTIAFPPLRLSSLIVTVPDSLKTINRRITKDRIVTVKVRDPWYIEGSRYLGWAVVGYAARMLTEPDCPERSREPTWQPKPSVPLLPAVPLNDRQVGPAIVASISVSF